MARNRFENLEPEKQEAILQAAGEEFAEKGFEAASINRIIKRSGMSKGSVYYYFEDKADLFATTLERSIQRIMEEIGWFSLEVLGPDEFWEALLELTHRTVAWARRNDWWMKLGGPSTGFSRKPGPGRHGRLTEVGKGLWRSIIEQRPDPGGNPHRPTPGPPGGDRHGGRPGWRPMDDGALGRVF